MNIWRSILQALYMAFEMFWEILWPLILGFALSGVVQAVVSKREISRLLPDDSPRSLAIACGLGAASSSCSYAAVALARSIFGRGANFTAAMAFELASTNLVAELAIILVILMGWQFMIAEFVGAPLMVVIMALLFRALLSPESVVAAKEQANKGIPVSMEGHAEMDMAVTDGPLLRRMRSSKGLTAISHYFVMDWAAIWFDIAVGFLLAGALAVVSGADSFSSHTRSSRNFGGRLSVPSLRSCRLSARWEIFRSPRCFGTEESALAAWWPSSSPI